MSKNKPEAEAKEGVAEAKEGGDLNEPAVNVEEEFLAYVRGDLSKMAADLGYVVKVEKPSAPSDGPVMLYHPKTREGRVFGSRSEAPADYITMDELRDIYAGKRK